MKLLRTIVSIIFVTGTVAIIVFDSRTEHQKSKVQLIKSDSTKTDSLSHVLIRK